jgi:hypothetical protein
MVSPTRKPHGTFDHHSLVWLINFESLRPGLCFQPQPSLDHKLRFAAGLFSSACMAAIHHLQEGLVGAWRASDAWLVALSSPASANQPSRAPQRLRPIKSERAKLLGAAALILMRRRPTYPSHDLHQATAFLQLALVANDG